MIERDGVVMFGGGSSSGVAIAVQSLAQELGVIFAGLTHSNDTTGKDRRRYGFRHFFARMSGTALGPVLESAIGNDRRAYHLTADYTWGWSVEGSIRETTEALGWETAQTVHTPLGAGDFSQYITPVLNSGADALVLNHYGRDMVNSLTQPYSSVFVTSRLTARLPDCCSAVQPFDGSRCRREHRRHLWYELELVTARRRLKGIRSFVRC